MGNIKLSDGKNLKLIEVAVERLMQLCNKAASDNSHGFVGIKVHYQDGVPQGVSRILDLKDK